MHPARRSLDALTGLRFVAAAGVVFHHFGQQELPAGPLRGLALAGFVGVDVFFLLSGFVLAYVYRPVAPVRARQFWAARLGRVYPLYLLGLLLTAPAYVSELVARRGLVDGLFRALASIGLHLGMVHAWVGHVGVWNVPDWSLSCEWGFYVVFPWLAPLLFRTKRPLAAAAAIWMVGIAVPIVHHMMHPRLIGAAVAGGSSIAGLIEFNPALRVHEFAVGILLGRCWIEREAWRARSWSGWGALIGACISLAVLSQAPRLPELPISNGLLAPAFALLVLSLANGGGVLGRVLSSKPLIALGDASYGIYILHWPLWLLVGSTLARTGVHGAFWLYFAVVILVSLAAYRWIEQPIRSWVRGRSLRAEEARTLAGGATCASALASDQKR